MFTKSTGVARIPASVVKHLSQCLWLLLATNICVGQNSKYPTEAIDATTVAVVRIDTKLLSQSLPAEWTDISPSISRQLAEFIQLAKEQPLYITFSVPYGQRSPVIQLLASKSLADSKFGQHVFLANTHRQAVGNDWIAFARQGTLFSNLTSTSSAAVENKMRDYRFSQHALEFVIQPPDHLRDIIRELLPVLPVSLGGGPSSTLTDGMQWIDGWLDLQKSELNLTVHSANHDSAERIASKMPKLLEAAIGWQSKAMAGGLTQFAQFDSPIVSENQVNWKLKLDGTGFKTLAGTLSIDQRTNRFKQVMLAVHKFVSINSYLPPLKASRSEDGSSKLSWRVHILPYIGERDLYEQFHLDEAWDSPHNRQLLERIPTIYRETNLLGTSSSIPAGYTTVLAPAGENTVLGSRKIVTLSTITDGTSNTIGLVDAKPENAVPWTSPQDYTFEPQQPHSGLNIGSDGRLIIAMSDGSIMRIRSDLPAEAYLNLFYYSDGNVVNLND